MANRQDLINNVASNHKDVPKKDIDLIITHVFDYMKERLLKKNRIEIRSFGSFCIRTRKFSAKSLLSNNTDNTFKIQNISVIYYRMSKNIIEKLNR
jgi:integration host factor subunit beta